MNARNQNQTDPLARVESHDLLAVLFVYANDGNVRCLSLQEAEVEGDVLKSEGWHHTATIHPARWIESLLMGHGDPSDMMDELQFRPANADGLGRRRLNADSK